MKIREIAELLDVTVHCGEDQLDTEIHAGFASDMMSDVLALADDQVALLTGLLNPQVIRTAEMLDIECIILVRGKTPTDAMLELAQERGLVFLATSKNMYDSCGLLYSAGLGNGGI